jgi:hypothetical protein
MKPQIFRKGPARVALRITAEMKMKDLKEIRVATKIVVVS